MGAQAFEAISLRTPRPGRTNSGGNQEEQNNCYDPLFLSHLRRRRTSVVSLYTTLNSW